MRFVTWNVGRRAQMTRYLFALLEELASSDHVIAALQEWTFGVPDLGPDASFKFVPSLAGNTVLVHSRELELVSHEVDRSGRAVVGSFRLPSGAELKAIGVHWHSRDPQRSELIDPFERGGAMALFRHYLDEDHLANATTAAVVMGDFNASPNEHEREMCSPWCLFALTERHRLVESMESVMGRDKRALVLVEADMPKDVGTYFWSAPQHWSVLDHILLTPTLVRGLVRANVITSIRGEPLLTDEKRVPRSKNLASDHLPVECVVHYQ